MNTKQPHPELDRAFQKLKEELLEGLKHGFFEYTLTCEVEQGRRRLTLKAGRSYRFKIPESEIQSA